MPGPNRKLAGSASGSPQQDGPGPLGVIYDPVPEVLNFYQQGGDAQPVQAAVDELGPYLGQLGNLEPRIRAIMAFLSDQGRTRIRLREMNEALIAWLRQRPDMMNDRLRLERFLFEEERAAGFNARVTQQMPPELAGYLVPDARYPTVRDLLDRNAFLHLLRNAVTWNDLGAGEVHGGLTHRIQWWLIMREFYPGGRDAEGQTAPNLYRAFADFPQPGSDTLSLWDVVVDYLLELTEDPAPVWFRSPETLTQELGDDAKADDWRALHFAFADHQSDQNWP